MRQHALFVIVGVALVACSDGAPSDTRDHTERITEATRDAIWIDRTWNNAYKGHAVEVDETWGLRIKQYRCFQRDNSLTGDKLDTALCDAKQDGWEWKQDPRRVPLMQIDPASVAVVSGKLEDDAQGLAVQFQCAGKPCWGGGELEGILCADQTKCDAAATDLKSLIALGAAAGASAEGDVFPKPEEITLTDKDVEALENLGKTLEESNQHDRERFDEAVAQYKPGAEAGDANDQFELAETYAFGVGGRGDHFAAFDWYKAAAEQGHADAQYALGRAHEHGLGVHYDLEAALRWYRAATSIQASVDAAKRLITLKDDASAADADEDRLIHAIWLHSERQKRDEAAKVFHSLALEGNPIAQYFLGHYHQWNFDEDSPPPDEEEAIKWYRLAAANGNVWAQLELAGLLTFGFDIDPARHAEAMKWYTTAAAQGSPLAKHELSDTTLSKDRLGLQ